MTDSTSNDRGGGPTEDGNMGSGVVRPRPMNALVGRWRAYRGCWQLLQSLSLNGVVAEAQPMS